MKDFFSKNRERILDRMMENEIAVLFSGTAPKSTADAMYRFKPNKNFFYFTGLTREHFIVTMLKLKDKVEVTHLSHRSNTEKLIQQYKKHWIQ